MSYTIVGMFPDTKMADDASNKLDSAGFEKEDYTISRYKTVGEYDANGDYEYEEDEKTTGFWNWLFGENESERKKYSYAGTKSNLVTVYTNDLDRAEKARDIMNNQGAINVNDFAGQNEPHEEFTSTESNTLSATERARIINKAKNDLYFSNDYRTYNVRSRGMTSDMDSMGTRDDA